MDPSSGNSAYGPFCLELQTLLTTHPPEFIYVQDTESTRTTARVVDALLRDISKQLHTKMRCATVDGVTCFTARLFYESVINSLAGWTPTWEDGCGNWNADSDVRWNENIDTFVHGLRSIHEHLSRELGNKGTGIGEENHVRLVIVVQRADRLKDSLPDLIVPLTRLAELTRLDICVIFISQVGWEDVKPPLGASPDPYYMDVQSLTKEDIVKYLIAKFSTISASIPSKDILKNPYHMALKPLYESFAQVVVDVCYPFTHNPEDLQYIAAARWPGYSKPLLDEYRQSLLEKGDPVQDFDEKDADDGPPVQFQAPSAPVRMRLMKAFNPSLTNALETLLPRLTNATDWALLHEPPMGFLNHPDKTANVPSATNRDHAVMLALPRISQFILLASFLASTNPAKSDFRLFHRGIDPAKRKRRATKAAGRPKKGGGPSKVAQRLLGPQPFPLDRMIAILGALLEDNDAPERELQEARQALVKFQYPGEATDMEISRLGVYSSIVELASKRLLHRTSPADRLDGPPMFKVAISYDTAQVLAKHLDVALHDLIWDPN